MKYWAFSVYSIFFQAIIWGIFGWAVFIGGHSGWWILLALFISGLQLKPKNFDIKNQDNE